MPPSSCLLRLLVLPGFFVLEDTLQRYSKSYGHLKGQLKRGYALSLLECDTGLSYTASMFR